VKAKKEPAFNVDTFLATVNGGRTISTYRKGQKVFRQGDPADAVFYLKEGKVKVCVISEQGKEAVVALHEKVLSARKFHLRHLPAEGAGALIVKPVK